MKLSTAPSVKITPIGAIETATAVIISRGPYSSDPISIDTILPSKNTTTELSPAIVKRELIVRAWLSGTSGPAGGTPIVAKNPLFKTNVNTNTGAGIFSSRGRIYMGSAQEKEDSIIVIPWGTSEANAANTVEIMPYELDSPSAEDPVETAIPLIAGMLSSLDGNTPCAPGVKVSNATRLYQKIIDLVAGYDFPYITF